MTLKPPRLWGISSSEMILHLKNDGYFPILTDEHELLLQKRAGNKLITVTTPYGFKIFCKNDRPHTFEIPRNHILERMGEVFKYSDIFCVVFNVEHFPPKRWNHCIMFVVKGKNWIGVNPYFHYTNEEEEDTIKFAFTLLWNNKTTFGIRNMELKYYCFNRSMRLV